MNHTRIVVIADGLLWGLSYEGLPTDWLKEAADALEAELNGIVGDKEIIICSTATGYNGTRDGEMLVARLLAEHSFPYHDLHLSNGFPHADVLYVGALGRWVRDLNEPELYHKLVIPHV